MDAPFQATHQTKRMLYEMMLCAEHRGAYVGYVCGEFSRTLTGFFQEVSSAFRFPYTFSWSWESLDACFRDLEWLSFSQLLWVISQPEKLFTQEEDHMAHVNALQRSIAAAASFWRERQIPFDCVLNLFE